jgi:hypothetical protein
MWESEIIQWDKKPQRGNWLVLLSYNDTTVVRTNSLCETDINSFQGQSPHHLWLGPTSQSFHHLSHHATGDQAFSTCSLGVKPDPNHFNLILGAGEGRWTSEKEHLLKSLHLATTLALPSPGPVMSTEDIFHTWNWPEVKLTGCLFTMLRQSQA